MTESTGPALTVPFLDLGIAHESVSGQIVSDFKEIVASSSFVNGAHVANFERAFADYTGTAHCVGVASGLDALRLALASAGVGAGDEVLVPAMTFIATWEAVSQTGAVPVPVDIRPDDYCIDVEAVAAAVGPRTAAVVPVHLYGHMADVRALRSICDTHGLMLVEDAAQAHGARRDSEAAGSAGIASAFSFYPGKNLGAFGDAGAVLTDDPAVAVRVRALREHGQSRKYVHDEIGWTARLDTIQAAVLLRKLPLLDGWNDARRATAATYSDALANVGDLLLPQAAARTEHVWHLYVIRTSQPAKLGAHLAGRRVGSGRHYPVPPHLTAAYSHLGIRPGSFPEAEALADDCLSLPLFPGITPDQEELVIDAVRTWFDG